MKNLIIGIIVGTFIFMLFLICQNDYAKGTDKNPSLKSDSSQKVSFPKNINESIQSLELKVENMEKYVDASDKNVDKWLKFLALFLSIIIGASIFNGLKSQAIAKEELVEIRKIKEDIKREANDAEDRLNLVKRQITQIEDNAENAKSIVGKMTTQLNEIGNMTDIVLNDAQKKIIEDSLNKTKEDLQKSGIETLINLFYAKALMTSNEEKWDDAIRLWNSYIDLNGGNEGAFQKRGYAYIKSERNSKKSNNNFYKALADFEEVIKINPLNAVAYNNLGNIYKQLNDENKAISNYDEAIRLNPDYAIAYWNRYLLYKKKGDLIEAEKDLLKAKELDPDKYKDRG